MTDTRPLIVHLSADYPDAIAPAKTRAIAALVEGSDRFAHRVYSLNRRFAPADLLWPGRMVVAQDDAVVASCHYGLAPGAMGLRRAMARVADDVAADLAARGRRPALVIGHKLSFEGLAAQRLARRLGVPFALTLQGNTDQKLLQKRPDLRPAWRKAWAEAALIFALTPWIARWCEAQLGAPGGPVVALPCIPVRDRILPPSDATRPIVTAFHLRDWRNKNLATLAAALARLRGARPELRLDIAGGGTAAEAAAVDALLRDHGVADIARRIGPVAADDIQPWMNRAALFVLPSRRESFGMVFIEALLAGTPIVYPQGAAVDGYFDSQPFARAVPATDAAALAGGMAAMLDDLAPAKAALAAWQGDGGADGFRRDAILTRFQDALATAIGATSL